MTIERPRPLRGITWLLRALSSPEAADAVAGDLLEELDERRVAARSPRWPSLWLHGRLLLWACAAATTGAHRVARAAASTTGDAARAIRRAPAHSLFILAVLAVGISAATVTFSVVDAVMLKPLPFDDSHEIVVLGGRLPSRRTGLTQEEFWAIRDHVPGLESVAPLATENAAIDERGTERLNVRHTMLDMFRVLKLQPFFGRLWTADEEARGDADIVVISHALWQRRFGGTPAVLGQSIQLADHQPQPHRIIGVLPPDAVYPSAIGSDIEMWAPRVPARGWDGRRPQRYGLTLGRLKAGVSVAQVQAQVEGVIRPLIDPGASHYAGWRPEVRRWSEALDDQQDGAARGWLLLLGGAVALIVLIACFNAANLMLARSAQRARELALRASLGASRRRLGLALFVESLMLSLAAAACGLAFAIWGVRVVTAELPVALFRAYSIAVDGRVFVAAMAVALVTSVIFGTVPAWQAGRVSPVTLLKDGGSTTTGSRRGWRSAFLVGEIACIGTLLVISTLFVTSFIRVIGVDLGFERSNLIAVATVAGYQGTVDDVKARFASIPGVTGVAAVNYSSPPIIGRAFGGAWSDSPLRVVGVPGDVSVEAVLYRVSADYFDVAGIPLRRGSVWSSSAVAGGQPMVIDELAARAMFGDQNPIGQRVRAGNLDDRVFTIAGVVPFVFSQGPENTVQSSAYFAMPPSYRPNWVSFLLRTGVPPAALVPIVQDALDTVAPPGSSPGAGVRVVDDGFERLTAARRFNAGLMTAFGVFSLLIGAAGVYAVMAAIVSQQTREIGIRVALGATTNDIRRGVLATTARHVLIGLALGFPVAWWVSAGFGALFFQVRPSDPSVYLVVTAIVAAVSAIGCLLPARRASRVDPLVSLRTS